MKRSLQNPGILTSLVLAPLLSQAAEKEVPVFNIWLHATAPESQPWDIGAELRGRFES